MSWQAAAQALTHERERIVAAAQQEADALLDLAREHAAALLADAQLERSRGYDDGHLEGMTKAQQQWAQMALAGAKEGREALERQRERLGAIVSQAVERVVEQEDRQAMFKRAVRTIAKLVRDVPLLTLRVSNADQQAAQQAVLAMTSQSNPGLPIEVVTDACMADGSCRFESDHGVIDAGLATQLAAIKRAVVRAALNQAAQHDEAPHSFPGEPAPFLPQAQADPA
jgi:type III secretion protein L